MDHALTHSVQQLFRAIGGRRVRIKIGPTCNATHIVIRVSLRVFEAEPLSDCVDRFGLRFVIRTHKHFGE